MGTRVRSVVDWRAPGLRIRAEHPHGARRRVLLLLHLALELFPGKLALLQLVFQQGMFIGIPAIRIKIVRHLTHSVVAKYL